MDKQYQIYVCEFDWYDEYEDEEHHTYTAVMGDSFADVMQAIDHLFPYVDNVTIHQYHEQRFLFLNKPLFTHLLESEYGLEDYGEEATVKADDLDDAFAKAVAAEFGECPDEEDEDDVGATPESANDHYPSWSNHGEIPVTDEEDARWNEMGHALERCSYY